MYVQEGYEVNGEFVELDHTIVKVIDGDSFISKNKKNGEIDTLRVRLIDAPEFGQDFFYAAKGFAKHELLDEEVRLKTKGKDRYGRLLVRIEYLSGVDSDLKIKDYSTEIVKNGLAFYNKKFERDSKVASSEAFAQEKSLNIWSKDSPQTPWDYRSNN